MGWISSSFDIAASVFGIIIGFCGNRRHKARILNVAFIVAALGSLCMFLPHFLTGLYQWGQRTTKGTCDFIKGLFLVAYAYSLDKNYRQTHVPILGAISEFVFNTNAKRVMCTYAHSVYFENGIRACAPIRMNMVYKIKSI